MIGKVRRMHSRDKNSVRDIVRATSLSRNTVRKYLRTDKAVEPRRGLREQAPIKLAPLVESITQALLVDARCPKKERRTAKALLKQRSVRPDTKAVTPPQGLRPRLAVDIQTMLVVVAHVTQASNDKRQIVPTLDKVAALPEAELSPEKRTP